MASPQLILLLLIIKQILAQVTCSIVASEAIQELQCSIIPTCTPIFQAITISGVAFMNGILSVGDSISLDGQSQIASPQQFPFTLAVNCSDSTPHLFRAPITAPSQQRFIGWKIIEHNSNGNASENMIYHIFGGDYDVYSDCNRIVLMSINPILRWQENKLDITLPHAIAIAQDFEASCQTASSPSIKIECALKEYSITFSNPTSADQIIVKLRSGSIKCNFNEVKDFRDASAPLRQLNFISIECPDGYYLNGICIKCPTACSLCLNEQYCLACKSNSTPENGFCLDNSALCKVDYCKYCNGSYNCIECNENYTIYRRVCIKTCKDGEYSGIGNSICLACPTNCTTCLSPYECTRCADEFILAYGKCILDCPTGKYGIEKDGTHICYDCSPNCAFCWEYSNCLKCKEHYLSNKGTCAIDCNEGTYPALNNIGEYCESCPIGCTSCESLASCTSCESNYKIMNGYCIIKCSNNQYTDSDSTCKSCPVNCASCLSSQHCSACKEGFTLIDSSCQQLVDCNATQYNSFAFDKKNQCLNCSNNCQTCIHPQNCIECTDTFTLFKGICIKICLSNQGSSLDECVDCSINCISCSNPELCIVCQTDYILINGECQPNCSLGQYVLSNKDSYSCGQCPEACTECLNSSYCLSCVVNHSLNHAYQCLLDCSDGKLSSKVGEQDLCIDRPVNCLIAEADGMVATCTKCDSEFTLFSGICYASCAYGKFNYPYLQLMECIECPTFCSKCNFTHCIECEDDFTISFGRCISNSCGDTKYSALIDQTILCLSCPPNCKECASSFECSECINEEYILLNGKCSLKCNSTLYDDILTPNEECVNCGLNCEICIDSYNCLACSSGYILNEGNCIPENDKCAYNCQYCLNSEHCLYCMNGFQLINGNCYKLNDESADLCSENCAICSSSGKCLVCSQNYLLYESECVSSCPQGFFNSNQISCEPCNTACKSCLSSNYCTECYSTEFLLTNGQCLYNPDVCKTNCGNGSCKVGMGLYFYNTITSTCDKCSDQTEDISHTPSSYVYQLCSGIIGKYYNGFFKLGVGFSGVDSNRNNICSIGNGEDGVIPPGLYSITSIECSAMSVSASRMLKLTPISKFNDENRYNNLFSSLYLYPIQNQSDASFIEGKYGIALPLQLIKIMNIGDRLLVSTEGCEPYVAKCPEYPPPTIGDVKTKASVNNELIINFTNWAGSVFADNTKFEYSAAINENGVYIELCESAELDGENLLHCNTDNKKRLGYFTLETIIPIRYRVKYKGAKEGKWSSLMKTIHIKSLSSGGDEFSLLSKPVEADSFESLIEDIHYKSKALFSLTEKVEALTLMKECPTEYCYNDGECTISGSIPICKCTAKYTGTRCHINKNIAVVALSYTKEVAELLWKYSNSADVTKLIEATNIILSNTEVVAMEAAYPILKSINASIDKYSSQDIESLTSVCAGALSVILNNLLKYKGATRRLEENCHCVNDTIVIDSLSIIDKIQSTILNKKAYYMSYSTQIVNESIERIINSFYFPSSIHNAKLHDISLSISSTAIVGAYVLPIEFSSIYPVPVIKGYTHNVISKVVSVATISTSTPYQLIKANKSVSFLSESIDVSAYNNATTTIKCGSYNEVNKIFSMEECVATILTESGVECICDTKNTKIYVVLAAKIANKSTIKIICGVVIPLAVLIIAIPSGIILGMRKVKQNAQKKKIVDSRTLENPKTGANELTA